MNDHNKLSTQWMIFLSPIGSSAREMSVNYWMIMHSSGKIRRNSYLILPSGGADVKNIFTI